ncbi:MAG: sulfatase [Deltaproteobacteria bacterium]|nr:sulfatase [Deltaproteobacteria bacterium]
MALVALALIVATLVACERAGSGPQDAGAGSAETRRAAAEPTPRPRIIILLSIDTLRADHLGAYGHERFTSPQLDALAAQGVLFEDASSTAPWTLPAHASMLTGLHPGAHGVRTQRTPLGEDVPTLPALLSAAGWQTAAVVNSTWLKRETFGTTRDFQHYEWVEDIKEKRTPTTWVTDRAIAWLRELGEAPLFLFMHYYDVHSDYASLPEYERLLVTPYEGEADGTAWQLQLANLEDEYVELCHEDFDPKKCNFGTPEKPLFVDLSVDKVHFDSADLRHLEELYDAGIRQLDAELGRFLRFLDEAGLAAETLLVVTSDHGEEFYDHGRVDHFLTQYQEVLNVPLLIRGPGVAQGLRVATPVSIVDIAPTLLASAGVEIPASLEGLDLAPLWRGEEGSRGDAQVRFAARYLYGEAPGGINWERVVGGIAPLYRSIRQGRYKLIELEKDGLHYTFYDLAQDPGERVDVSTEHPALAARMRAVLRARAAAASNASERAGEVDLDAEEAARLRALGYIVP